ncbi:RIP metalloprotease RseP [Aliifodinibius sp. S!AR15-10]|uniref:RIP metalloprotease RseP n=1 Tax=Aliifodinibius sp. S!AR15-10 TaxID=2950437 RepID=UPI0028558CBF|nr:RIP metalloprotease RseP [Aliifodinibius sp. S!AR15-10]MDR8392344.1 RIP metalloprotease RseP [Aliifodinibius sp. S!AR15-10]
MEWVIDLFSTLGIFALALLILVFFHELGHFLAAKLFGMRVERFSLGFPPRIWGFQKGETDYCVGATPLGGYVKISGMIDESMDTEHLDEDPKPWEYRSKPVWQRMVVITAGVIFNMVLAVMIYAGIALSYGESNILLDSIDGVYIHEESVAAQAGFKTGDKIVEVNGQKVKYFKDLVAPSQILDENLNYTVMRDGQQVTIGVADSLLDRINKEGFLNPTQALPSLVNQVQEGSPADTAGLMAGDRITGVNGQEVGYWLQLVDHIQSSDGALQLTVLRDGVEKRLTVTPNDQNIIGISAPTGSEIFQVEHLKYGLTGSIQNGFVRTGETFNGIIQGFSKMFSGSISVRENLGGPVAIANVTKQATESGGALGFWQITAFLSITLAIMNILPIPVLDGGHLMFLIYEGVTRREPSAKVRMALQQIGFILIIALFIFVTFNDIIRQFG